MPMDRDGEPAASTVATEEAAEATEAVSTVTYEQLADLETDFDNVDLQLCELHQHGIAESRLQMADKRKRKNPCNTQYIKVLVG